MPRHGPVQDGSSDVLKSGDGGPLEAATFISQTVAELAPLAHRHQLDVLALLLEMVQLEARDIIKMRER